MFDDPIVAIKILFLPLISAQLLLIAAGYLAIVRKRIAVDYKLYIAFLVCLAFFQLGPVIQKYSDSFTRDAILYTRVTLLFTIAMPALLIANVLQLGISLKRWQSVLPFILGAFASLGYVVFHDLGTRQFFIPESLVQWLPLPSTRDVAHRFQFWASLVLGSLPCSYFVYRALQNRLQPQFLAFTLGGLVFCVLFSVGSYWGQFYLLYYAGSIVTAVCWIWAVFHNINQMKGQAAVLIDELHYLVQSNRPDIHTELETVLAGLQSISAGDISVYKLRVREILNRLTEASIQAGSDSNRVLAVNSEQTRKVEQSEDIEQISQLVREQVEQVSKFINDQSAQHLTTIVKPTQSYLSEHFANDIDIDQLAERVSVSRSYLMRIFKKEVGMTINQYLTELRIEHAKNMLQSHSVTDTAFAVGFNNSNYFGTVFKKATGITPSRYQQKLIEQNLKAQQDT
ncbi:hypothetical protein C2869_01225 [Saccharobesus litoralis]|uniref:HTH araC/xylS-type domain-containing protein n=1 Tax=Saccharobesus litoralis TaxID=2172099 RepID=A0A2S0VLR4_9ALTE|nr:AraC family transcriptional regulator [Saccharobesus litoralis]AWB65147.1 hypothetical protein C2869_01225 [Saccharobesus litoralis]